MKNNKELLIGIVIVLFLMAILEFASIDGWTEIFIIFCCLVIAVTLLFRLKKNNK